MKRHVPDPKQILMISGQLSDQISQDRRRAKNCGVTRAVAAPTPSHARAKPRPRQATPAPSHARAHAKARP